MPEALPVPWQVSQRVAAADFDLGFGAEDGGLEVDGQIEAQVVAALLAAGALLLAAHVEHFAEEVAEEVADVHASAEGRTAEAWTAAADAGMAVAVVGGALVGVAEHLVGLAGLLEFFFGGVIAGVEVRMVLASLLAIGALQLLVAGVARDAENFVIVCFAHSWVQSYSLFCCGLELMRTSEGRSRRSRSL